MKCFTFSNMWLSIRLGGGRKNCRLKMLTVFFLAAAANQFLGDKPLYGAEFFCSSGDVTCLIAAINDANGMPGTHIITLEPGVYTLQTVDNVADGPNGLPSITGSIQIQPSADNPPTVIERDPGAPIFRVFHVSLGGELVLERVIVQRGRGGSVRGPAIFNRGVTSLQDSIITDSVGEEGAIHNIGTLNVLASIISDNSGFHAGGGIHNETGGTVVVENSTIAHNISSDGGGIRNLGSAIVKNSSVISNNTDNLQSGGGINNTGGSAEIINSTIAKNTAGGLAFGGGGVANFNGQVSIANSTIRENQAGHGGGGIVNRNGTLLLQNTIVAGNRGADPFFQNGSDCLGIITSLGNNLAGDPTDCGLQPSDLTGDPGLGALVGTEEDALPGRTFYPVLEGSPVIDKGNKDACPQTDQLGNPRVGICDIGAIEFYPLINDLVSVGNITTAFDPTPLSNAPAGTFSITAEFINSSAESIFHHFAEVSEISGGDLLLNADGGAGGVGAQLTPAQNPDSSLAPGASEIVQFAIGLQAREPFTFFVNIRGDAR